MAGGPPGQQRRPGPGPGGPPGQGGPPGHGPPGSQEEFMRMQQ